MTGPAGLPSDPAELLQLGAQKLGTFKSALEASVSSLKAESSDQASLKGLLRDRWVKLTEEYVTWVQMTLLDPVKAPDLKSERRRLNAMADAFSRPADEIESKVPCVCLVYMPPAASLTSVCLRGIREAVT